jgi:hypothetical protein
LTNLFLDRMLAPIRPDTRASGAVLLKLCC